MFDFFSLMVAVVALIVAAKTFNQIAALRARLDSGDIHAACLLIALTRASPISIAPCLLRSLP